MAAGATDVVIRFLSDVSDLKDSVNKIQGSTDKFKTGMKAVGAAVASGFAVKQVGDWVNAAEEANAASATLAKTLQNAGDSTGQWAKHAEDLANTLMNQTGIDDEVIKGAQSILATFHSVGQTAGTTGGAFDRASAAALDMSKAGFGSVDSAATMLGKALEDPEKGLTALGKAGVTFSDDQKAAIKAMVESGDKAGAMNAILQNVEGQVGGVATASATAGDKMKTAFGETQESLGQALLPAMQALAPILQSVAGFIQENAGWLVPLAGAVAAVTIAVWAFNAALAANPIVLVTIAVAALVAGIILLWQNWDTVWSAVLSLIQTVWDWISTNWPLLAAILTGPFGIAVLLIVRNWDTIKSAVSTAVDFIRNVMSTVADIISAPFRAAHDAINTVMEGVKTTFDWAIDHIKGIWNAFARFWNAIEVDVPGVTMPGPIPNIPGFTFGLPDLPMFAKGGIVTGPTLGLLGESGPEAVIPLGKLGPGNVTINITTTGLGADAPQIQRAVVAALRGHVRRNGPLAGLTG